MAAVILLYELVARDRVWAWKTRLAGQRGNHEKSVCGGGVSAGLTAEPAVPLKFYDCFTITASRRIAPHD